MSEQAKESCAGCWWREGGRCYVEPCERNGDGTSKKLAVSRCDQFLSKRQALSQVIPSEVLTISSEHNDPTPAAAREDADDTPEPHGKESQVTT